MKASIRFDMRAPEQLGCVPSHLYAAALEMANWADRKGFEHIQLTEHHGVEDGYNPSPIVLASAMAARTTDIVIRLGVLLLPLYDPIKAAEDLAVLDLISAGRLDVAIGAGYRATEYPMFGRLFAVRPRLIEEAVEVVKQAWTGEPFDYRGQRIRVSPRPQQRPRPRILLGGSSNAAARRAARIADGFYPTQPQFDQAYRDERIRLGLDAGVIVRRAGPIFIHVARDPEAAWARIGPHALHENMSYFRWQQERGSGHFSSVSNVEDLRAVGAYVVVTPEQCLAIAKEIKAQHCDHLQLNPLIGGLDPEVAWEGLELFAAEVLPHL